MKYLYAAIAIFLGTSQLHAQWLVLSDNGITVNGTTVVKSGQAVDLVLSKSLVATLDAGIAGGMEVNVRRYEITVSTGTANYFCWGVCYLPVAAGASPVWSSAANHSINLAPGVANNSFSAYHEPLGHEGVEVYRYVWYDVASPNDSVWVDVQFDILAVGLDENINPGYTLDVHPNPVHGGTANISYTFDRVEAGTELILFNALGERVRRKVLVGNEGRLVLDTHGLGNGMYFLGMERSGRLLGTHRIVVTN